MMRIQKMRKRSMDVSFQIICKWTRNMTKIFLKTDINRKNDISITKTHITKL